MTLVACPPADNTSEEQKNKTSMPTDEFIGSWASVYGDWFSLTSADVFTCYNNGDIKATLEEAKSAFTIENGAFNIFGIYTKK